MCWTARFDRQSPLQVDTSSQVQHENGPATCGRGEAMLKRPLMGWRRSRLALFTAL
jgi:hypothetical protein